VTTQSIICGRKKQYDIEIATTIGMAGQNGYSNSGCDTKTLIPVVMTTKH
jgi:hypothetical protein